MSFYCSFCDFTAPTRARYMRHLGTQKHARNYLEGTKHLIKTKGPKKPIVKECEEETVQEEIQQEIEEKPVFTEKFFLDLQSIRLFQRLSESIELSPLFVWIITLFNQFKNIIPQNTTIESNSDELSNDIFLGR